jgi:hypothetical protein
MLEGRSKPLRLVSADGVKVGTASKGDRFGRAGERESRAEREEAEQALEIGIVESEVDVVGEIGAEIDFGKV